MTMRIDIDTQIELFAMHAEEAVDSLLDILRERRAELIQLAQERAFATVGIHEYGDATYWLGDPQLEDEMLAELADAIFYRQIQEARDAGTLPPVTD